MRLKAPGLYKWILLKWKFPPIPEMSLAVRPGLVGLRQLGAQAGTKAKCQSPADLSTPLCSTPQPLQSSAQLRSSGALPALTPCTLLACFLNHSVPPAPLHTRHPHRATFHPSYPSHLLTLHLTHPHTPDSLHLLLYPHTALSPLTPHPSPLTSSLPCLALFCSPHTLSHIRHPHLTHLSPLPASPPSPSHTFPSTSHPLIHTAHPFLTSPSGTFSCPCHSLSPPTSLPIPLSLACPFSPTYSPPSMSVRANQPLEKS